MDYYAKYAGMATAVECLDRAADAMASYAQRLGSVKSRLGLITSLLGYRNSVGNRSKAASALSQAADRGGACLDGIRIEYLLSEQKAYQLISGDHSFAIGDGVAPSHVPTGGQKPCLPWSKLFWDFLFPPVLPIGRGLPCFPFLPPPYWMPGYVRRFLSDKLNVGKGASAGAGVCVGGANEKLPPDLRKEVEDIIGDKSMKYDEKADRIISVYEKHLNSMAEDAFAEYNRRRAALSKDDANYERDLQAAEDELNKALAETGLDIRVVLDNMGDDILRATGQARPGVLPEFIEDALKPMPNVPELVKFYKLVAPGSPLDLKSRAVGGATGTGYDWSIWSRQWVLPGNTVTSHDYAGNYLFGYYGSGYFKGYDMSDQILLYGAGAGQLISDFQNDPWWPDKISGKSYWKWLSSMVTGNYGDNIGDANMIKEGIDAYNANTAVNSGRW